MIGLVFATLQEARPFLAMCNAGQSITNPFTIYQTATAPQLRIIISGMGKVAAAAAAQALILSHQAQIVINAGACGALRDAAELAVGQLVNVSTAVEGDHELFGKRPQAIQCCDQLSLSLPTARLVTCDRPVFDVQRRNACAKLGDVVDMEGAAIARVTDWYQIPCQMIKGITDAAQPTHRKTLLENLNSVSEQIGQLLWKVLK